MCAHICSRVLRSVARANVLNWFKLRRMLDIRALSRSYVFQAEELKGTLLTGKNETSWSRELEQLPRLKLRSSVIEKSGNWLRDQIEPRRCRWTCSIQIGYVTCSSRWHLIRTTVDVGRRRCWWSTVGRSRRSTRLAWTAPSTFTVRRSFAVVPADASRSLTWWGRPRRCQMWRQAGAVPSSSMMSWPAALTSSTTTPTRDFRSIHSPTFFRHQRLFTCSKVLLFAV